ncbi:hypothetical protein HAX54_021993 [Datura stramonium]|uniref:Lipoxygenase n=1 Tax=Datura stramonium TaxID=4076 RepID=A0ABS8S3S4_DATST|nr:hypothetical protein [Datura stramonium]
MFLDKIVDAITGKDDGKKVKGRVILMKKNVLDFTDVNASVVDGVLDFLGRRVSLQLISTSVHDANGLEGKRNDQAYLENWLTNITPKTTGELAFTITFDRDYEKFGVPGGFIIKNLHFREFFLKSLTLEDVPNHGKIHFVCNSWIYPAHKYESDRIFLANQAYLPSETPEPLRKYRDNELVTLRGDGTGKLEEWDRVYDYAYYNDLGDPDKGKEYARPVLGGSSEYLYPRRGRTGLKPTKTGVEGSIWQLAKAYVAVNDMGIHELISHWLKTHAVIKPLVIATNRQQSVLHPIHKLLQPHFRDTMNINALARQVLINCGGFIELIFFPAKYSMELSAVVYKDWVFPEQSLPDDLIKRGVAVEDSSSPHGIRLLIQDYPYAVDGLEICIIIWIASALHAAANFGQYPYGGYLVNRPTLSRKFMPEPGSPEYEELKLNPDKVFLKTIVPPLQTLVGISVLEVLSRHTSDTIYLGQSDSPEWTKDQEPLLAFERFGKKLCEIECQIIQMNGDHQKWKNRSGPVKVPYTLLFPTSEEGVTGKGVPNSVCI